MRVCVAFYNVNNKKIEEYSKALSLGLEKQGAIVELVDISKESDKRLTGFKYILLGCGKSSLFSSKVDQNFSIFLKNCGQITGKHTFAFTNKRFGDQKFLIQLMKDIEKEGVLLKTSSIIGSSDQAKIIGSKLHIK